MSTLVPKREAPKPNGILNYARRFVHNKTKAKWSLDKIQAALEEKYPEKKWSIFMNTWKEHHPIKEPVVYTEVYKKRLEQGYKDKDNNWYRSGEKKCIPIKVARTLTTIGDPSDHHQVSLSKPRTGIQ